MKKIRLLTAVILALCFVLTALPAFALVSDKPAEKLPDKPVEERNIHSGIVIDTDAAGGYTGDYVVIYNPATSSSTSYSTGTMTGLIETSVGSKTETIAAREGRDALVKIDVDGLIADKERAEMGDAYGRIDEEGGTRASYNVGDTRSFTITNYNPGSGSSLTFKVLAKGQHCYIWTPSQNLTNYYTLDSINPDYAQQAADEFDRMYDLMNSSFGSHNNGSNGDGRVSLLFYNIDDGFDIETNAGYVAGYFSSACYSYDGLPIINIDTYPGVYFEYNGHDYTGMDNAYGTACHEYQHCINYSNTSSMSTWLNECFSAAAEEICYPGSSIVSRIMSWENYSFNTNNDWLNPPTEFAYQSSYNLHKGYSMYTWNNNLDDILALYAQVSFFAQYLFTQYGNGIYKQISNKFSSSEVSAITSATGTNCADLVKNFRVAVTANATEADYGGIYGFKAQSGYDPSKYHDVENPYSLLAPIVFTGSSCSIKGGGAITVKPVNGVYNPPSGASSSLKYIGITVQSFEVTAVANNDAYGTLTVNGTTITAAPIDGYYVESAEVISGTATVTVNGNTISVNPSSDCTVRVNFAPKPSYTVSFVACGASQGSQTAYANDVITLPSTENVNPEGWTFSGWVGAQIEETTTKPTFYAPGASYTVTGNATLYALYTSVEEGGETVYEKTTSLEVGGKYIIASGSYAVGNTVNNTSNNHYINAQSITVDGNYATVASSVGINTVLWQITSGSSTAGFVFQNVGNSKYMCLTSDEYLTVGTTQVAWLYESTGDLNNQIDSEGYYYLAKGSSNTYFTTSKNSGQSIVFYGETTTGLTYYTTDPVAATPSFTVTFVDWNGTVLSTQTVEQGQAATAPANPTREGYTFTGWDVDFTNVTSDLTVTAQYTINSYTLTIKYVDENGVTLASDYVGTFAYGETYSVTSPVIDGYTTSQTVVTGTMGAANKTVTVTYTKNAVTGLLGDVNCDGVVDFSDVTDLFAFMMNTKLLTDEGLGNADVNGDGAITMDDVSALYTMILNS